MSALPTAGDEVNREIVDYSVQRSDSLVLSSPNKLKLGIFGPNLAGGACAITRAPGPLVAGNWAEIRGVAIAADRAGFEALIPVARWKGYGAPRPEGSGFMTRSYETLTWGAAVLEATDRISVFTTCHVLIFHPVLAAKMGVGLDHIGGGRWGLNVVAGWAAGEFDMFGSPLLDHERRYRYADEWMHIVDRLWTEDEPFDFNGEFFKLPDAQCYPKPVQSPKPIIMNAGSSAAGSQFAANHADCIFINLVNSQENLSGEVKRIKAMAHAQGREVSVWANAHIVAADTERDAREYVSYYADKLGDREAAANFADALLGADARSLDVYGRHADRHPQGLIDLLVRGGGNLPLVGSYEQVVEQLDIYAAAGLDGLAMTWINYEAGIKEYEERLLPLMRHAGLRQ